MQYQPKPYQLTGIRYFVDKAESCLFLEPGMGKTSVVLTGLIELFSRPDRPKKVLVIAPLRVADAVWTGEIEKWNHTRHLRASKVLGTAKQRLKALEADADVYLINRENVAWLVNHYKMKWPFDCLIIDELSSFKSSKAKRFRALRTVRPFIKKIVGLTGTPMPNGLLDLWPEMYLIDMGQRLGKSFTHYRDEHFVATRQILPHVYQWELATGSTLEGIDIHEKVIYEKLQDICLSLRARDWLDLPPRIDTIREVLLSREEMQAYRHFEREAVMALEGHEITAVNAADLAGKLLQCAGGAIYVPDDHSKHVIVHDAKLDVLEELLEELNGRPAIVCYWFKHERDRIVSRLRGKFVLGDLTGDINAKLAAWNAGKIQVLLVHPQSAGHGLNMQEGGRHMIWFSNPRSTELYLQTVARLDRQGGVGAMINVRLCSKGTVDEVAIKKVTTNTARQDLFLEYAKQLVGHYQTVAA